MWSTYGILDNKFSTSKLILPPFDRPFGGSSEGWLVTLDESLAVTLYKPFVEGNEQASFVSSYGHTRGDCQIS